MANQRLNAVITHFEQGEVAFGGGFVPCGGGDVAAAFAGMGYDWVLIETEHEGFEAKGLRQSLQFLLRGGSAFGGDRTPPIPFVRLPPNGREKNQWLIKQALDQGVMGIVLPHMETVEEAQAAVRACRYPQARGVADAEPAGERGMWPGIAAPYWGLDPLTYYDRADLWPLDPNGEVVLMPIIESPKGVENVPEILRQTPGIGAIWAGPGDLSIGMGVRGEVFHPDVEDGILRTLKACQEYEVPCCAVGFNPEDAKRRIDQGFSMIFSMAALADPVLQVAKERRKKVTRARQ